MARAHDAGLGETADSAEIAESDSTAESARTWLGGAGLLAVAASFVVFGGLRGLLAAAVVAVGWYLLPNTYAFALGQVALVSAFSTAGVLPLAVAQAGLLGVLFAPMAAGVGPEDGTSVDPEQETGVGPDGGSTVGRDRLGSTVSIAALGLLAGGVAAWASQQSAVGLPVATLLLVGVLGLAAYGLHRYQLVALGLVGDAEPAGDSELGGDAEPVGDADEQ